MANKQALRELQTRLAERLSTARAQPAGKSWLAVECGARGFLFPLREAGEIYALASLQPVPHAHRWFLGVKGADSGREQARLVSFNPSLEINCALLVDRLSGLRSQTQLTPEADDGVQRPAFVGDRYRDPDGRLWQELRLAELAADGAFLRIVA